MKKTIIKLAEILENEFKNEYFPNADCRNKRPGTEWVVVGHSGITRAIKIAGLQWNSYWSGSNPTPSTQAPKKIVNRAYELAFPKGK